MLSAYAFDPRLIIRTPAMPVPQQIKDIDFGSLLSDPSFLEALYVASPVLYEECIKYQQGQLTGKKDVDKLTRTVLKYYLRMSTRATPFGLFSGCGVASWSESPEPLVISRTKRNRHTRLDMHYLCALGRQLSEIHPIREKLLFYPNNSLYAVGTELRYVEYLYVDGSRRYRISSVSATDYLGKVLDYAANGITIPQLVAFLANDEIDPEDARAFIGEMIDCQLLVSQLEPSITGEEFMEQIYSVLKNISADDPANTVTSAILHLLAEVRSLLEKIDHNPDNSIEAYKKIIALLQKLDVPFSEGKLFQADLVTGLQKAGLDGRYQTQLREALHVLNKLTFLKKDSALHSFAARFFQRYEHREMPLMEVLDTEIGIGYIHSGAAGMSPLLLDLHFSDNPGHTKIEWSELERLLSHKLNETLEKKGFSVTITEKELEKFSVDEKDLPPSIAVLFRATANGGVFIESAGGSSAVNLLSRFAHADTAIKTLAADIAVHEQLQDPDVIYAEIVHLPESRTGNILLHPAFRNYEIPYLASSSLHAGHQIGMNDLYVSVRNGKVILRSKKLDKQIIPRLSTAHNYTNSSLQVYRFLCDLQLQDKKKAFGFSWGSLQHQHRFLPRVVYKNTILHLARWNFLKEDITMLKTNTVAELEEAIRQFRDKWRMPRHIVLSEGDNELLIDLEDHTSVSLWIESVRNQTGFTIKEFPWPDSTVTDENKAIYANQLIAILIRNGRSYEDNRRVRLPAGEGRRLQTEFALGTEWVYFKLYCGVKTADRILAQAITPLVAELTKKNLIDKWFFIRYNDPEFHLRIRFHLKDCSNLGEVIAALHKQLNTPENIGYVWKQQTDTYKREVERYGPDTIHLAESLFHLDSIACLAMLDITTGDERETIRWIWSLRAVDELFNAFYLNAREKLSLVQDLRDAFSREFNLDKTSRTQLNDKYRENRKIIDTVMSNNGEPASEWEPLIGILTEKSRRMMPFIAGIVKLSAEEQQGPSLREMLGSYSHMMLNRIITADARMHELVIYDFLVRHYKSLLARENEPTPGKNTADHAIRGVHDKANEFVLSNE